MKGIPPLYFLKNYWFVILFPILFTSCSGNRKIFTAVEKDLSNSPVFEHGFTGLAVYDPSKKKMIFEYNSGKYFLPASNTKLLTFYAGLKILGDSVPGIRYTIQNDSLIFTGTGDPSLLNPDLPQSGVFDFLKKRPEKLFYLPSSSTEKVFGPGWAWDDYNASYSTERSAFPVSGNMVRFSFKKGIHCPELSPEVFIDSLFLNENNSENTYVKRELGRNIFHFSYSKKEDEMQQKVPFKTSIENSIRILEDTLDKKIKLLKPDLNIRLEKTLYSIPTDSLYKRMLQDSDNFIAEQILLMASNEIADSLQTKIAIKHMKENFLKDLHDKPKWVDGSGLSRYNLATPRSMVRLLENIKNEVPYSTLFELLPAGGRSGTIKDQFQGNTPYIFAKTGSLSNNYSLSGYLITKKGEILIFSFMNNNFTVSSTLIKQEIEQVLQYFRNKK